MKKFLQIVFNIAWIIFCGLEIAITEAIIGALCCITIVGIPFGLQHFKFIKLAFAPAGRVVAIKYSKHPFMNTFYGILGGFESAIIYNILGIILCITVIGFPLGVQMLKFGSFNFGPFGAEIVHDGEFTSSRDTNYDLRLLKYRVNLNPDKLIKVEGEETTVRNYVRSVLDSDQEAAIRWRKCYKIRDLFGTRDDKNKKQGGPYKIIIGAITAVLAAIGFGGYFFGSLNGELMNYIYIATIVIVALIVVVSTIVTIVYTYKINSCCNILFAKLYDVYDTKEPMKNSFKKVDDVFKYIPKAKVKVNPNDNGNIPEL